ncbi:MAG: SEL1-like repeat protein [Desulfobacteraceae bacterium]|nr:SEL1-like repeat protein [Desulfobacteraceae bacterium]
MKRIFILFVACIIFCVCSASVFKNPVGLVANQKADDYYDRKDYKSAFINYKKASELGIPEAQYYLANMYLEGKGSKKNTTEAIIWLGKSANGGFAPAQVSMGLHYQFGSGVSKDLSRAYKLFLRAAKAGAPEGQYFLAFFFATGQGTAKSNKKALKWFRIAKSNGFPVPSSLLSQAGVASIGKKGWIGTEESKESKLVWQIQSNLTKLGYKPGPVDGLMGKKTDTAIRLFQEKNGLVIDGKPSDLLLIKIKKVYNPSHNKKH